MGMTANQQKPAGLFLSIATVLYGNDAAQVQRFCDSLSLSVQRLRSCIPVIRVELAVVDNAAAERGDCHARQFHQLPGIDEIHRILPDRNLGYGRAHNLCINPHSDVHLILNPDVYLDEDALVAGVGFLNRQPETGMVTPFGVDDHNQPLFLSKRYPTVLDFLLRGFAPAYIRRLFSHRLAHYEMQSEYLSQYPSDNVEIASGCCMLVRTALLRQLHGFCEEYFLYFEDFDLSVRLREHALITFVPQMKIVHDGGHAARKGWWHIRQFATAGYRFFSTHGWQWW